MKNIQMKYNFLHILYWMATCCIFGYVAVFLQYKGMSNTQIGLVTGGGCVTTIFLSPIISSLVGKVKGLTIRKLFTSIVMLQAIVFLVLGLVELPAIVLGLLYISIISLSVSTVPILSTIAMNYIKIGQNVNFGLSRGMGSVSYAISAVVLGQLVERLNPTILAYGFVLSGALLIAVLFSIQEVEVKEETTKKKGGNPLSLLFKYKTFALILIGFACMFAASTSLSTYLINIVKNLGGSTSLYGIAIFCMAASEMPIMAVTPYLLRKFDAMTLIMIAACFYILRNFAIALAPSLPVLFFGMLMQGMSYGLLTAVITYYVTFNLEAQDHMMGQTLIGMMTSGLGSMTGNLAGGFLQDNFGITSMFIFACIMTTLGVLFIVGTGLGTKLKK